MPDTQPALKRAPYLQSVIADSLTVLWRTDIGTSAALKYRLMGTDEWQIASGATRLTNTNVIENEVTIHSLVSDTTYEYQIFTNNFQMSDYTYRFRSASGSDDQTVSFFAVGDIGSALEEGGTPDLLGKALEKEAQKFDLGVLMGDITYYNGKKEDYDHNFFRHFDKVFAYVPVYPVMGNHDWNGFTDVPDFVYEWKLPHNEYYYSFDYGNVHFIGLDSKKGEFYEYEQQVDWLKKDLSNIEPDMWIVVFLHYNGKSCTYKNDNEKVMKLYPLFEMSGVDLVLNGHAHTYERLRPMNGDGVPFTEAPGDSIYTNPPGFISLTVGSGGILRGFGQDPKPMSSIEDCTHPEIVAKAIHDNIVLELHTNGQSLSGKAWKVRDHQIVDRFTIHKTKKH